MVFLSAEIAGRTPLNSDSWGGNKDPTPSIIPRGNVRKRDTITGTAVQYLPKDYFSSGPVLQGKLQRKFRGKKTNSDSRPDKCFLCRMNVRGRSRKVTPQFHFITTPLRH
ncbi:hypothetical protein CDAR_576331 [Caerostris darwini]|uniref:Uncharacterized protein n=1 Tax=Caerostris darwini TaxID=1538125 RepID=A0AAV4V6F9_9ARAC|nr:hypothetical protein CDAR_576331 [Caerostris darwini]